MIILQIFLSFLVLFIMALMLSGRIEFTRKDNYILVKVSLKIAGKIYPLIHFEGFHPVKK